MSDKKTVLKVDRGEFPDNSHKSKEEKSEKKVEKVVTGKVIVKKKSLGRRFADTFIGEEIDNVPNYVVNDVLIPAAMNALSDALHGAIEMIIPGGSTNRRRGNKHNYNKPYVSYDKKSYNGRREISHKDRARHNFDDIVLETRGEAEEVLSHLVDLIIDYGQASVSDLYDLVDITGEFTDTKWGWTDLGKSSVSRGRDGYFLNLPRPKLLD